MAVSTAALAQHDKGYEQLKDDYQVEIPETGTPGPSDRLPRKTWPPPRGSTQHHHPQPDSRAGRLVGGAAGRSGYLRALHGPAEPLAQQPFDGLGVSRTPVSRLITSPPTWGGPDLTVELLGGWPLKERLLDQQQLTVGNCWLSAGAVLQRRRAAGAPAGSPAHGGWRAVPSRWATADAVWPSSNNAAACSRRQRARQLTTVSWATPSCSATEEAEWPSPNSTAARSRQP